MITKLTLTIEKDVVLKAKEYARKKRRSVSNLVEDYLNTISDTEAVKSGAPAQGAPLTRSVTGMFKEKYTGESYDELLESALMDAQT